MVTGIIGLLGALAGFVPSILQFLTLKANNAQSLELKKLEIEAAKENIALQVDLAQSQADIEQQRNVYNFASAPSGVKWVDALAVFVRPYITLVMFHAWIAIEGLLLLYGIANGAEFEKIAATLWDADAKSLFAAIIGFWFGDRGGKKLMAATLAVTQPVPSSVQPKGEIKATIKKAVSSFIPAPLGDRPGP
jgi:hypothetical protein